jgi:SpoVK/Ycf46/Vps4 family AAA+-type ATPase
LIIAATKTWNAYWTREQRIRFHIRHAFGTANMLLGEIRQNSAAQAIENEADSELLSQRLLEYQMHELGAARLSPADAASSYALSPAAARVVEDIKYWQNSRSWYRQRGIPWRRGLVLHGPPGSGKTAFARLLAESLDMPIMVFHLNTLRDGELHTNWQDMLHDVPCVALIEDIDTVFRGRENHAGGQLTFDTLLNCIDGAERTDGVLVCITTNDIRHIDPALGIPCSDGSSRPGRIDCILEFGVLPEACRWQLCRQIVADYPALHADLVAAGAGDTGAQFQERCARLALREFWKQSDN